MTQETKEWLNGSFAKSIKIAVEVAILLFAVGVAWATLNSDVKRTGIDIDRLDKRVTTVEIQAEQVRGDLREIKVEQKYIKLGIDEIKTILSKLSN